MINFENIEPGVYFLFGKDEKVCKTTFNKLQSRIFLNFAFKESIKVPDYFKENKLQLKFDTLSSYSEVPEKVLNVVLELSTKTNYLIIGTAGLSSTSIIEIATILKQKRSFENYIFLFHLSKNNKDLAIDIKSFDSESSTEIKRLL
ncbi:hypothetical protein [Flavobacterium sp.]|uniref:hypothetical protein n=1 Tax=Flavobacterium sp. TaxID=239 RepID=UPI00261301EA|nr:hypothetical protein [Flavobacterium sp.]